MPEPERAAGPEPAEAAPGGQETGRRRNRAWRWIGAGIGGAVIAALVLAGVWRLGYLPQRPGDTGSEWIALSAKIAALEGRVRELAARTQPAPDQKRTEEIDARLKKLEAAGAGAPAPASDPAMAEKLD